MNRDGSAVLGSARGSRAGEGGPLSRTFLCMGAFLWLDSFRSSFRRAAETSTRAARTRAGKLCAPRIAAEPPVDI
jgi:hypothetical protein